MDTTGDNDKIIPNKLEVAKSTEWKDFVASLKQIKDAPDITDGVIEQTDWNKINVISKNDWFKEQEDELLKQLKELGCDLKKDDNPNLDFFNFTDGKFKHTKDSEDPDSAWTDFIEDLKTYDESFDIEDGLSLEEWTELRDIAKDDWDKKLGETDGFIDEWIRVPIEGFLLTDGGVLKTWVAPSSAFFGIGFIVLLCVVGWLCTEKTRLEGELANSNRGGNQMNQGPASYNMEPSGGYMDHGHGGYHQVGNRFGRRRLQTPLFKLAREIGIHPACDIAPTRLVHGRNLTAEANPPTIVQEVCEFTGFAQKDLLWVIPLSCLTQALWIYVGYKIYKGCRRNRSDNDRSRNQHAF